MTRWIEVSHWGNIAVEESFTVKHSGAKLKVSWKYRYSFILTTLESFCLVCGVAGLCEMSNTIPSCCQTKASEACLDLLTLRARATKKPVVLSSHKFSIWQIWPRRSSLHYDLILEALFLNIHKRYSCLLLGNLFKVWLSENSNPCCHQVTQSCIASICKRCVLPWRHW